MNGAVITGVLIAVMFLVSFSQWFYHLIMGLDRAIINDVFVLYRAVVWGLISIVFMAGIFWMLAMVSECPSPDPKEGVFKYINCTPYFKAREILGLPAIKQTSDEFGDFDY